MSIKLLRPRFHQPLTKSMNWRRLAGFQVLKSRIIRPLGFDGGFHASGIGPNKIGCCSCNQPADNGVHFVGD